MSEEEMNKKMEFIIEWQAKFAADIEVMREIQAADSHRVSDALLGTMSILGSLIQAQKRTDENLRLLTTRTDELAEAQKRTDERLNIFINVVERYISGNGGTERHA